MKRKLFLKKRLFYTVILNKSVVQPFALMHPLIEPTRGFVKVVKDRKEGFLNEAGIEVLPCKYDNIKPHDKDEVFNLFSVRLNWKWALLDKTGKPLTTFLYDRLNDYFHYVRVAKGIYFGLLDKQGKEVLPCEYDQIELSGNEKKMTAVKNRTPIYYYEVDGKLVTEAP